MVLAMENAGQLIEDEELRAQIKGSGIGTSATRAEIIKKLVHIGYLNLNKKTQVLTPERFGEMVFEVVSLTVPALLNPKGTDGLLGRKGRRRMTNGTVGSWRSRVPGKAGRIYPQRDRCDHGLGICFPRSPERIKLVCRQKRQRIGRGRSWACPAQSAVARSRRHRLAMDAATTKKTEAAVNLRSIRSPDATYRRKR